MTTTTAPAPARPLDGYFGSTARGSTVRHEVRGGVVPFMTTAYSITNGIGAGFISWVVLQAARARAREVHPLLWVVSALFVVYSALDPIQDLLGV